MCRMHCCHNSKSKILVRPLTAYLHPEWRTLGTALPLPCFCQACNANAIFEQSVIGLSSLSGNRFKCGCPEAAFLIQLCSRRSFVANKQVPAIDAKRSPYRRLHSATYVSRRYHQQRWSQNWGSDWTPSCCEGTAGQEKLSR